MSDIMGGGDYANDYAFMLWNAGCRLIPKGAIVLTKEECDNKVIMDKNLFEILLDNAKKATRIETAMEILDDIFSDYYRIGGGLYELTPCDKKFIYKKYGIEVE